MGTPIKWRSKVLLAKIETTYGTDATPTGAANAILAVDVQLSPMQGNDVDRNLETPYLGAQGIIPSELHRTLSFKVELQASGTAGTAPAWGPLLRACAVAETIVASTSVTYNPISDAHEAVTIYLWIGGTLYTLTGARGNVVMRWSAQGIPYLEFSFTGLYSAASETAQATPDLSAFQKPKIASKANTPTFTIEGDTYVLRQLSLDLGNQVELRPMVNDEKIIIVEKNDALAATIEAVPLSTLDPMALAEAQTEVAVQLVHGTAAGKILTLDVPTAQFMRLDGLENTQDIVEWPLRLTPVPASGNDQWTLTLT